MRLVPPLPMLSCLHLCRCYSVASVPWYQRKVAIVIFATPPSSSYEEVGEPLWSRSHTSCVSGMGMRPLHMMYQFPYTSSWQALSHFEAAEKGTLFVYYELYVVDYV